LEIKVPTTKMDLIADDRRGPPGKRVKWVEDFDLEPQIPGIMALRLMAVVGRGQPSPPFCRRQK
jgi:hypothetical protein